MDTAIRVRSLVVALFACLALAVVLAGGRPARAASIVYVVPGGAFTQTGASWGTAKDLAAALAGANPGDELWVKAGMYKPTTGGDRNATFALKSSVAVYGGFAGTETARSQRDWRANIATLSGDIGVPNNVSDNSYHVVTAGGVASTATLDGFTIMGGNANGLSVACPLGCGGGVYVENSAVTLNNLSVVSNAAAYGGGGVAAIGGGPTLTNVTISGNTTTGNGGGMFTFNASVPTLTNVIFSHNATTGSGNGSGGGLFNYSGSRSTLTNVLFSGNSAVYGGGMTNYFGGSATLTNATFSGNTVRGGRGGGVYNANSGSAQIRNSILWGDNGGEIFNDSGGSASVTYSLVQGGYPGAWDADPLFISASDLRLQAPSPAINAGNNAFVPSGVTTDVDGQPRIVGGTVDMGAYEFLPTCPTPNPATLYANAAVDGGAANGETWADAYPSLSQALQQATFCPNVTQVWVAQGVYTPTGRTAPIDPRSATFALKSGVALYGGFSGGEVDLGQRSWQTHVTTLSGDIGTPGANSDNIYHIVTGSGTDATARLDGFTISGANATNGTSGGGLLNINGSPTLANITFSGNFASNGGGLANEQGSAPTLTHVTFSSNGAVGGGSGGGVYNSASRPSLSNVTFSGNFASNGGGLANANNATATLTNVTFSSNAAIGGGNGGGMSNVGGSQASLTNAIFSTNSAFLGGGLDNEGSSVTLTNVAFGFNSAIQGGGGLASFNSSTATLTNTSFNGNVAANFGGLYSGNGSSTQVRNSILWGNTATVSAAEVIGATVSYSIVRGSGGSGSAWWSASFVVDGGNNLDANPLFIAPPGDLRLSSGSPAMNAGNNVFLPSGVTTDLDGAPRIVGGTIDMGAYEAQSPGGNPGTSTPSPTATPTATATPAPTATPTGTATLVPTATPTGTATPVPTVTPSATATDTPAPAATSTPAPTTCNPDAPGAVCRGMVILRAFIDFRCDGFYNAGTDWPLVGTTITATLPDGATRTTVVDSAGNALITGVSLAAGQAITVTAADPPLPAWVAESGWRLQSCAPTQVAIPTSRFSAFGTATVDFRWNLALPPTP